MMRLRRYLKNSARPALIFSFSTCLFLSGCSLEPTYKERDIPRIVQEICKNEYNLDVTTRREASTLWIYAPMTKFLDKEYGIKEDKIIDEEIGDRLRNIIITIGRVLINSDNVPDFYVMVTSDINLGLDYILIGYTLDIKKSYAGYLPWTEANKRYVIKFNLSPTAVGDTTGTHINYSDIKFTDFLSAQIAQRIAGKFQQPELKKYFQVEASNGSFSNGDFIFEYSIKEIAKPEKQIDIKETALDTIAYCVRTYEFKDFNNVEITNLALQDKLTLNQGAILARPLE